MRFWRVVATVASLLVLPSVAFAQATIAGSVKDASGAVLPGVTVEAASPALIEKTRTAVTDGEGQFKIIDLRPGTYSVTFTLAGFSTLKRDGIELTGTFTATVNAELKVGAVEESITVTGETPIVDVQSAKTQSVLTNDIVTAIPTARNYQNLHVLVPGITIAAGNQDVGGSGGDQQIFFHTHGGSDFDSRVQVNGLMVGDSSVGGGRTLFIPSVGTAQETAITTSGGLGESETAGVVVNIIQKDGGNTFKGSAFATGAGGGMISNNYDDSLKAQGLRAPNNAKSLYDFEGTFGGPLKKDRLWFFSDARFHGNYNYIAGMYPNLNAGNVKAWTYAPDLSNQSLLHSYWPSESLRLTWQATPRNKFVGYYEDQLRCVSCAGGAAGIWGGGSATQAPEAAGHGIIAHPSNVGQIIWTSPVSNRVLLESGFSVRQVRWGNEPIAPANDPALIQVSAQGGSIPGLSYRACNCGGKSGIFTYAARASITYTSGSHSAKFGYNSTLFNQDRVTNNPNALSYRFTTPDPGGVPNQLTMSATPFWYRVNVYTGGFYAQDQWTLNRLTLGGGVRYDLFFTHFPAAQVGPTRFMPVPLVFDDTSYAHLQDLTPRMSAAYDVFGTGKTAIRMSFGKYLVAQDGGASPLGQGAAPVARIPTSINRAWTDSNNNFIPDCDLLNLNAQNLTASGGDVCGVASNLNYGKQVFSTNYDPNFLRGWGVRPYNWELDLSVQHQILPRVSVTVGYFRRWFGNFAVTNNLALAPSDYNTFNLPVPNDARLPISGTLTGFTDVSPAKTGQVNNFVTSASSFSGGVTDHWNGVDFTVNARLKDVNLQGGVDTGKEATDFCSLATQIPSLQTQFLTGGQFSSVGGQTPLQYCKNDGVFLTQVKMLGSYLVPKVGVQVAATFQNIPGQQTQAVWATPNATVQPLLGRALSGGAANTSLALLPVNTYFGPRVSQLDFRASKILRFGRTRSQVSVDLYNALNSNTVQTFNSAYLPTGTWNIPTLILPARVVKVSAQFDF